MAEDESQAGAADNHADNNQDAKELAKARQRTKSWMIALVLGAMAVLIFLATVIRLGGNVASRQL